MDSVEQAEGQKRVRQLLVEPLKRRGLVKPSAMTKDQFSDMLDDLCARLAYMSEANLGALEEEAATMASGKNKDRFPIAQHILDRAGRFQQPPDDASPLIRAVFAHAMGRDAITQGWAPELLREVRNTRRWPNAFVVSKCRENAEEAVRRVSRLIGYRDGGQGLTAEESAWL